MLAPLSSRSLIISTLPSLAAPRRAVDPSYKEELRLPLCNTNNFQYRAFA